MYEVETREVPEQKVLNVQRNVFVGDLSPFISEALGKLYDHLAETGLSEDGACFVVYHGEVNEDSDGPVETCVPFTGSAEPVEEMRVRLEPYSLQQLARQVHASMARAIQPFHTLHDGDVLFAVSTDAVNEPALRDPALLGTLASELAWDAVLSSAPQQVGSDQSV